MDVGEIHRRLRDRFENAVAPEVKPGEWPVVQVQAPLVAEVGRFLRDDPDLAFDCLSNLSGVDRKAADEIEVWYHLMSYRHRHQIALVAATPRPDPVMPTVSHLWPIANWLERECFDLLGVSFTEHPDLRRILMPEDWVGHPLRKDFVEPDEYHGISTRRESLLKL
ncbi:MAG TPA: NADH-quinone oxidoreductase subunit C [Candidatus Binatia bacterium]|nr:NADH-quinone oxidoreductase subunit C [Candidatus Binatia bacterium]